VKPKVEEQTLLINN